MAMTNSVLDVPARAERVPKLMQVVRAEYAEMPGLSLTLFQAQRLWAADRQTCESVLMALITRGFLRRTSDGRFIRA